MRTGSPSPISTARPLTGSLASEPVKGLAVEIGEGDPVRMGDDQVEHRPAERQAARLAREAPDHLGPPADLAERALEQVGASPAATVAQRIAQVDAERLD